MPWSSSIPAAHGCPKAISTTTARSRQDCADTINWLADQPWSNGKVGMTGVSYLAAIQFWARR
jgi:predicted acyl esterase